MNCIDHPLAQFLLLFPRKERTNEEKLAGPFWSKTHTSRKPTDWEGGGRVQQGLPAALTVLSRDQPFLHKHKAEREGFGAALQAPESLNMLHICGFRPEEMIQGLHLSSETYGERSEALSSQQNIYEKTKRNIRPATIVS